MLIKILIFKLINLKMLNKTFELKIENSILVKILELT